jgi:tetratricopeptide (TPR) repeat protein
MQNRGSLSEVGRLNYLDFELEIGIGSGQKYPLEVVHSPAGEVRETMHFPFGEVELENRLKDLQIALLSSGGPRRRSLSPEEKTVQEFGKALFEALLTGEVRGRYDVSQNKAAEQGKGLRLKLRILPPELAMLPWEFLYDSRLAEYMCLSRNTPLVRYLELPRPIQPLTVPSPLRILGMVASPNDLPLLDVAREKRRVEEAVGELQAKGLVTLTWLKGQTWRDLQGAMRRGPWHVFHFVGHGGAGYVALVDEGSGKTRRLKAMHLGRLLADHRKLRLALLNVCEGARGNEWDIFSSTAALLVRRGIPAVLAMQHAITDRAAIEFASSFYEALADGMPVDASVGEARKAISFSVNNTLEWGTPVLYMRSPDGVLFRIQEEAEGDGAAKSGGSKTQREPTTEQRSDQKAERLQELYVRGDELLRQESWGDAVAVFTELINIDPGYRDAWEKLDEARKKSEKYEDRRRKLQYYELLYIAGKGHLRKGEWQAAVNRFANIVDSGEVYKDTEALLEKAEKQLKLETLHAEAVRAIEGEKWEEAIEALGAIDSIDPTYRDCPAQLEYVRARHRLQSLYEQALGHMREEEWTLAIEKLKEVAQEDPAYPDAADKLEQAQEQKQIADIFTAGVGSFEIGRWLQAIDRFTEVIRLAGTDYKDALERLERARKQRTIEGAYRQGEHFLRQKKWREAESYFERVYELAPKYRDVQARLEDTRKRQRLEGLRKQGEACLQAEKWQRAVEIFEELSELDPKHSDIVTQLEEATRQLELDDLYHEGIEYLERKRWRRAEGAFAKILRIEPDYRDVEARLEVVRKRLARRSLMKILRDPFWQGIGGLVGIIALIVTIYSFVKDDLANLIAPLDPTPKPPGFCNGNFENGFVCWEHGGELNQAVECGEDGCIAVLGDPSYTCRGGVPIGDAWIRQTVKVPDMISPTLLLDYRIFSYDLDLPNFDYFEVAVNGEPLGERYGNYEWNGPSCDGDPWDSGWQTLPPVDLGLYRAKEIQISFHNVNGTQTYFNTWTFVDNVRIEEARKQGGLIQDQATRGSEPSASEVSE